MSRIEESTLRKFLATAAVAFALSAEAGAAATVASSDARRAVDHSAAAQQSGAVVRRAPVLREVK